MFTYIVASAVFVASTAFGFFVGFYWYQRLVRLKACGDLQERRRHAQPYILFAIVFFPGLELLSVYLIVYYTHVPSWYVFVGMLVCWAPAVIWFVYAVQTLAPMFRDERSEPPLPGKA